MNNIKNIILENAKIQAKITKYQNMMKRNNEKILFITKEAVNRINNIIPINENEPTNWDYRMDTFKRLKKVCEERSELKDNLFDINKLQEKFYSRCGESLIRGDLFDRLDDDIIYETNEDYEEEDKPQGPQTTKIRVYDSDDENDNEDEDEQEQLINAFKSKLSKALNKVIVKPTKLSECKTKDEMRHIISKQMNKAKKEGWNYESGTITMNGYGLTFN